MKNKISITMLLILMICFSSFSQGEVKVQKLLGEWQLVIDIEEAMEEAREETKEDDNILAQMLVSSVTGLVESVIENIDIYFTFLPDGELEIYVEALGEQETEYGTWFINEKGQLIIEGDDDEDSELQIDDVDYWLMDGNKLYSYGEDGDNVAKENVYMLKIE